MGSIQYLKNKFGKGYLLDINAISGKLDLVEQFVHSVFPLATPLETHVNRTKYRVPLDGVTLSDIFGSIEVSTVRAAVVVRVVERLHREWIHLSVC